jgi:hypothetical protein
MPLLRATAAAEDAALEKIASEESAIQRPRGNTTIRHRDKADRLTKISRRR